MPDTTTSTRPSVPTGGPSRRTRSRRRVVAGCVGATAAAVLGTTLVGAATAGVQAGPGTARAWTPPADTIVEVTGDAANGFSIRRFDGSTLHPPTDSEAAAECSEYDTEVQVAVCNAEVETWYRDLADLQVALRWARYDAGRGSGHRLHS